MDRNRRFRGMIRQVRDWEEGGTYETLFLMEGDSIPVKSNWLNHLLKDMEEHRPFAIIRR